MAKANVPPASEAWWGALSIKGSGTLFWQYPTLRGPGICSMNKYFKRFSCKILRTTFKGILIPEKDHYSFKSDKLRCANSNHSF